MELKPVKFMGGEIRFVESAVDKIMPNGEKKSWERSVKIIQGKKEIKIGRSFFEKMQDLLERSDVGDFIKDIE